MKKYVDIEYRDVEQNEIFDELINRVIEKCFEVEKLENTKLYVSVILVCNNTIQEINKKYRDIDKATDVLSFPMFEKDEIFGVDGEEAIGDIVISIEKVKEQAIEYNHSFERELAYMLVHGFYHLMGEDHIEEEDKIEMRRKEERVLKNLKITRQ